MAPLRKDHAQLLILAVEQGEYDDILEALTAACHNRKIMLRSGRSRRRVDRDDRKS